MTTALFIGRFHPFHFGHTGIVEHMIWECDNFMIGIGSCNKYNTLLNPFHYTERHRMVSDYIEWRGYYPEYIPLQDFADDKEWMEQVIRVCPPFDVVYSNNPWTIKVFEERGIEVRTTEIYDGLSGTEIRRMMTEGNDGWRLNVPSTTETVIDCCNGVERIKKLCKEVNGVYTK